MAPPPLPPLLHHACLAVLLLLAVSADITLSQNIVETLPGFPGKLPFKLETGYIGVGDSENRQIFYYFFESERDPKNDPLLFFLTGGPGCSGIHTIIYEIGPFELGNSIFNGSSIPEVRLKPYSWTKVSNLLVIDQPVGTGYSYAKTPDAYKSSDSSAAEFTYQFLKKWLAIHPQYLENPLYVGGDSYGGFYAPQVTQKVYNGNDIEGETHLNIKGFVLGNPLTEKYEDYNGRIKFAHKTGLLSDSLYKTARANCNGNYLILDPDNSLCRSAVQRLDECLDKICLPHILEHCCEAWGSSKNTPTLLLPSSVTRASPYLSRTGGWCDDHDFEYGYIWANNKAVQEALHVREGTITEWVRCNSSSSYFDFGVPDTATYSFNLKSIFPIHQDLTNRRARGLIYSGDHDFVVPHTSTEEWISKLKLPVESGWRPWFVDGDIAGYVEKYSHLEYELTYATVKGAGHLTAEQKPEESFSMISRWLAGESL